MKSTLLLGLGACLFAACNATTPPSTDTHSPEVNEASATESNKVTVKPTGTPVRSTPIEGVFELQQANQLYLIDTRPPIFYSLGHIDGAKNIPLKSFNDEFMKAKSSINSAVAEGKKIVIYCQSEKCKDSAIMARLFMEMGYDVSIFKGGWELWKMSGL